MAFSLLNGLSQAGKDVSAYAGEVGLAAQKADLAEQQLRLADSLATTRETTLLGQKQTFEQGQQGRAQAFQGGENAAQRAAAVALENMRLGGTASEGAAQRTATAEQGRLSRENQITLEKMRLDAPPETIKLLRALGAIPDPAAASAAPRSAAVAPGGNSDVSSVEPAGAASDTAPLPAAAATKAAGPDLSNPLVRKALGFPAAGSEDSIRQAIADDVGNDPKFKGSTVGQRAAEIESRLAVASGKMTDPASRESMAKSIASYQLAPLTNFALTKSGGPETMARVMELNPDYQEGRYPEVVKAMAAFGSGKQGDIVRSLNVGIQHLDTLDEAAQALKNGDLRLLNALNNRFHREIGAPAPTTFEGLKHIVGTEIQKAVAGGIGSEADRERLMKALDAASSPAQLTAITNGFRALMGGQMEGLKAQYEDATGFKTGPFAFETKLAPSTVKALGGKSGAPSADPERVLPGAEPPSAPEKRPPLTSFMGR